MNIIAVFWFSILSILLFTYYVMAEEENKSLEYARNSCRRSWRKKSELISIRFQQIENQAQCGNLDRKLLGGYDLVLRSDYVFEEDGTSSRKEGGE